MRTYLRHGFGAFARSLSFLNQVLACARCNSSKGTLGLYEFFHKAHPEQKNFFDFIPALVEKKYLKTILKYHECAGTLDASDLNGDGVFSVLDIDAALREKRERV